LIGYFFKCQINQTNLSVETLIHFY
jgi:hypothetical protein